MTENNSVNYVVTISDKMGEHQYTIKAQSKEEAESTAKRKLSQGQVLVKVVKSKIQ